MSACDGVTTPTGLDENFTLAPGDRATVSGTSTTIKFLRVEGDSRCPADAVCIQGGDAIVKISARTGTRAAIEYDLHTGSMAPVTHDDLTIALVELQPYPFSGRTTDPDDYRATLRVSR
jgi:hypothetical protein